MNRYLLLVVVVIFASSTFFPYNVSFKNSVVTSGGPVTMLELTEASDTDVPPEVLEKIIVAYLPVGNSILLNKRYLVNLIKKRVGVVDAVIDDVPVFVQARATEVNLEGRQQDILDSHSLPQRVIEELSKHYPKDTVFKLKSQTGQLLEHDSYQISVQVSNKAYPFVRVTFKKSGRTVGYVTLQYDAILIRKVASVNRKVDKGEIIGVNDVKYVEVNVLTLNKVPVFEEDLPLMTDKVFLKDEILDQRYMKDVPIIVKGQLVKAYSVVGGIMVSTLVQALEHGYVGNVIRLKNLDNGAIITGTVKEDGSVSVLEVK
ncbi:MAG: flagellar basal body P-ring formation chaperone FlgA [Fervidobacterium sp.]|uniref:Flagella basal body P-ring formation protein FlgA n=1 Tax=Fervidobacterium gondwanense DSM 13020 TaxID=1121883 RepID=A0A1M7T1W5_FERGO|nr:flagellar basal body P-ring formation chaperone FlgA [Fervidobacterium gondwanense]UXF01661.1 flagellar basal body P-ring biosynthesis protein FlgA [Fervidobacterium riparium]SHN64696.1 flagella basal body P-ring formation protein FlgA [Fervidobacterium gondwanense DSM 13020]